MSLEIMEIEGTKSEDAAIATLLPMAGNENENRDEMLSIKREEGLGERDQNERSYKETHDHSRMSDVGSKGGNHGYMYTKNSMPGMGGAPLYPPLNRGQPFAPPSYAFPTPHNPFVPPPSHPFHHPMMPPYCGPPYPAPNGRSFHSHGPPPYGAHPFGSMPHYHNNNGYQHMSDNTSVSSSTSNKKRTIDGVHERNGLPSHAYSFRRTESNVSSTSTVTAGNNASFESLLTNESPMHENSDLPSIDMNAMGLDDSRQECKNTDDGSIASTLTTGGFSHHSYEGPRGKT